MHWNARSSFTKANELTLKKKGSSSSATSSSTVIKINRNAAYESFITRKVTHIIREITFAKLKALSCC